MNKQLNTKALFFASFLAASNIILASETNEAITQIKTQVEQQLLIQFSQNMSDFNPDKLQIRYDNALQLFNQPTCSKTLELERIKSIPLGKERILVRCQGDKKWAFYLPIEVSYLKPVVISQTNISNNQIIDQSDITLSERDIGQLNNGYYTEIDSVLNQEARRNLAPGTVLNSVALQAAQVISRGDAVLIQATSSGITVRMQGYAMTSGRIGKQIQVRNKNSGKVIRARVVKPGVVEVSF